MAASESVASESPISAADTDSAADEKRMFTSPGYATRLLVSLDILRSEGQFCDYVITADGLEMPVHRTVLLASSDYFRVMLTGRMRESHETSVVLQEVTSAGLQAVIEFIYSGSVKLSLKNVEEVLAAASLLLITEVVDHCATFLNESVTLETAVDILNISDIYSLTTSNSLAYAFIQGNFLKVAKELPSEFAKLSVTQLEVLLADNALNIRSEYQLFRVVLGWIQNDVPTRAPLIAQLMRNVRLPLCSAEELVEVSREPLVTGNTECYGLLVEAKDYQAAVNMQPLLQTTRTQVRSNEKKLVVFTEPKSLMAYDLSTGNQTSLKDAPVIMYDPSIVVTDNFLYACGGCSDEDNTMTTPRCHRYDPRFNIWVELEQMQLARDRFAVAALSGSLYAIGGRGVYVSKFEDTDTVERYSIGNNAWTSCCSLPSSVAYHQAAVCDQRIYISGGILAGKDSRCVLSYDPVIDAWREEPPMMYARYGHSMAAIGGTLYVVGGGYDHYYAGPVEMFSPGSPINEWTECTATIYIEYAGMAAVGDSLYIVGGVNLRDYEEDAVLVYTPHDEDKFKEHDKLTIDSGGHDFSCCSLVLPS